MNEQWIVMECDEAVVARLSEEAGVSPVIARVLCNRGITTAQEAQAFFNPSLDTLHAPFDLPDMEAAATRIADAIRNGERICVHGDYDVDGVTSSALLVRVFRALGGSVEYRLPHRKKDGYDIKAAAVEKMAAEGIKLIITCDCGINATAAVEKANELGIDIIISDHHQPGPVLPPAFAVVNPKRAEPSHPFHDLAGVGVAYKLAQAVVIKFDSRHEESFRAKYIDLVALGTVADVVPLLGENRTFVKHGLEAIASSKKTGIQSLLKVANPNGNALSTYHVAFILAPRINAVGRMDSASKALELLLTQDSARAAQIVAEMEQHNTERKVEQDRIMREALAQVEPLDLDAVRVLVLSAEGWNTGVVGIAAGRICELFGRPAILLNRDEQHGTAHGSARSTDTFDMLAGLDHCRDLLGGYGGHACAAGLSLSLENLEEFDRKINEFAAETIPPEELVPRIMMDAELAAVDISRELADAIATMEPFGAGNPEPLFMSQDMTVVDRQRVGGDGAHLKLQIKGNGGSPISCIGFGLGDREPSVELGSLIDLCYTIRLNTYNGFESVQLVVKAIRS